MVLKLFDNFPNAFPKDRILFLKFSRISGSFFHIFKVFLILFWIFQHIFIQLCSTQKCGLGRLRNVTQLSSKSRLDSARLRHAQCGSNVERDSHSRSYGSGRKFMYTTRHHCWPADVIVLCRIRSSPHGNLADYLSNLPKRLAPVELSVYYRWIYT